MQIEEKIKAVTTGLTPDSNFPGQNARFATIDERMHFYRTPGVSVTVVDGGKIEWSRGFGIKRRGKNEPVTQETLFQAGSISKPIFALSVAKLMEEGRIDITKTLTGT